MLADCLEELEDFLKSDFEEFSVVAMPDFFLDRFVSLNFDDKTFAKAIWDVIRRKGGSIDEIEQIDFRGGNAVNTASALASLGVKAIPIVCTSRHGKQLIKLYLKSQKIDLSHIKIFEKPSITTAMEFQTRNGKTNVMLRDVGDLANFGPQHLDGKDFRVMENADYVCVFNWAGTQRFGTKLAEKVFQHVKTRGRGKTYYDTADPTPNKEKMKELVKLLQSKHIDILSVNENEAVCYASQISQKNEKKRKITFEKRAKESAKILASNLHTRVDLHTTSFSATFTRKTETIIPVFKVPVLRVTGAGDAWNAGNILGDACNLSDERRLTLANLVAAYYISNLQGKHATRKELIEFCKKLKRKSNPQQLYKMMLED